MSSAYISALTCERISSNAAVVANPYHPDHVLLSPSYDLQAIFPVFWYLCLITMLKRDDINTRPGTWRSARYSSACRIGEIHAIGWFGIHVRREFDPNSRCRNNARIMKCGKWVLHTVGLHSSRRHPCRPVAVANTSHTANGNGEDYDFLGQVVIAVNCPVSPFVPG